MTSFDKREQAFEGKFAHDEELKFAALARRNKLAGQWAAAKLGLSGDQAETYAKDFIVAGLQHAGDDDVVRKLKADLTAKGIATSDQEIADVLEEMMKKAKRHLAEG